MRQVLRIALRVVLMLTGLAIGLVLWVGLRDIQTEQQKAHRRYLQTAADLERTTANLSLVEGRLVQLTGNVDAVENEARVQLRLVKPGERLILVEYEPGPVTSGI